MLMALLTGRFLQAHPALVAPDLVVISILSFIGTYGEFIIARTLLTQREMQTVMVGLQIFTSGQYTKTGVSLRLARSSPPCRL